MFMLPPFVSTSPSLSEVSSEDQHSDVPLFPVRLRHCGSVYQHRLYDIDGNILRDDDGNDLHLFNPKIKEFFSARHLRCIRHPLHDYRYFVRTQEQLNRFQREREKGSEERNVFYFIYKDNDHDTQIEKRQRSKKPNSNLIQTKV